MMKRALRAGHPFSGAIKLVSEELEAPLGKEFGTTFADLNYGNDVRRAMLGLLQRVPSVPVMALVTSVLVQKETGGNLAEILGQISTVVRGRFRFERKIRTLSAEGRMSAWILALVPIVLFGVITVTTPDYLPTLTQDPLRPKAHHGGRRHGRDRHSLDSQDHPYRRVGKRAWKRSHRGWMRTRAAPISCGCCSRSAAPFACSRTASRCS